MSYTPTTWKDGDLVTSAKLNKIEQGIANNSSILIVHGIYEDEVVLTTLDKTFKEISESTYAILKLEEGEDIKLMPLIEYYIEDNIYYVSFFNSTRNKTLEFVTDNINGYPLLREMSY